MVGIFATETSRGKKINHFTLKEKKKKIRKQFNEEKKSLVIANMFYLNIHM